MEMIIQGKTFTEIADAPPNKKRKWETDVHHHRKADDLGAAVKVLKWVAFFRGRPLQSRPSRLKLICSESASLRRRKATLGENARCQRLPVIECLAIRLLTKTKTVVAQNKVRLVLI